MYIVRLSFFVLVKEKRNMKMILRASLSAVLVLSLVGCGSTKDEAIYQDSIDAYVNEIDMDYCV